MNSFPSSSNLDTSYLYGEDRNGNQIKVINYTKTQDKIGTTIDCNKMTTEGAYAAYQWNNGPGIGSIGILEVLRYSDQWILQRFTSLDDVNAPVMFIRRMRIDTWTVWKRVTTE